MNVEESGVYCRARSSTKWRNYLQSKTTHYSSEVFYFRVHINKYTDFLLNKYNAYNWFNCRPCLNFINSSQQNNSSINKLTTPCSAPPCQLRTQTMNAFQRNSQQIDLSSSAGLATIDITSLLVPELLVLESGTIRLSERTPGIINVNLFNVEVRS